jgi:hypothetical protein
MTRTEPNVSDCIFNTILGFLLPFFLAGAGGNQETAKAAIRELVNAYSAGTPRELDLAGRIVGFAIVAMDNLRLSMTPGLSDTNLLRYRCNAVTLSRSSETARKMLDTLQAGREVKREVPRPSVAAAPPAPKLVVPASAPAAAKPVVPASASVTAKLPNGGVPDFPMDIETMKRDARIMMAAFSKNGASRFPDPDAAIRAVAKPGFGADRRASAG